MAEDDEAGEGVRRSWRQRGAQAALVGGLSALGATALLPLHLLGEGSDLVMAVGFLVAALWLAPTSMALAGRMSRRGRRVGSWAAAGAAGFVVSGAGLLADVLGVELVLSELLAVVAVGLWWGRIAAWALGEQSGADGPPGTRAEANSSRALGWLTLVCACATGLALSVQLFASPSPGAVPARFAYVLWGPWGLVSGWFLASHPPAGVGREIP